MSSDITKYKKIYDDTYQNIDHYNFYDEMKNAYVDAYAAFVTGKILDAGCGEGIHLKRLHKKKYDVLGIELSKVCCERYLQEVPHQNIDIVSFAKQEQVFAGVICMDVLEHIPPEAIDETLQALKSFSSSLFLGIANHPDVFNGVELHLIQHDSQWWIDKLKKYYSKVTLLQTLYEGRFFLIDCSNRSEAVYEQYSPKIYDLMQHFVELQQLRAQEQQNFSALEMNFKQETDELNNRNVFLSQETSRLQNEIEKSEQQNRELIQQNQILLQRYHHIEKLRLSKFGRALRWLRRQCLL